MHLQIFGTSEIHSIIYLVVYYRTNVYYLKIFYDYAKVPWEAGSDAVVTASMTLSPKDGGKKAPAAVVGFQMPMRDLYKQFIALTSVTTNPRMNCEHNWIDCYLLDQNGFVVISEAHNDTGQFMGTQEGAVMVSMVKQGLYNPIDIYDYQAWCQEVVSIHIKK